jgi:hypothetical protein
LTCAALLAMMPALEDEMSDTAYYYGYEKAAEADRFRGVVLRGKERKFTGTPVASPDEALRHARTYCRRNGISAAERLGSDILMAGADSPGQQSLESEARALRDWAGPLAEEVDALERHGGALTRELKAARLTEALVFLVAKLAEAHRRELDEVVARVKRLEEDNAALRKSCVELGVAEDYRNETGIFHGGSR